MRNRMMLRLKIAIGVNGKPAPGSEAVGIMLDDGSVIKVLPNAEICT